MDIEKRKQLKELVIGMTRTKQRHNKICIKIRPKQIQREAKQSISPLLKFGLFSFSKEEDINKFGTTIYEQINYAVRKLCKPDALLIQGKKIKLTCSKGKLLLLDLDETLIYSNQQLNDPDFELFHKNLYLKLNIRPYCSNFLKNLSKFFDIFIFTSATLQYAKPIVKFLNSGKGYIKGILHREHCLKTKSGLFIKDLRIIENIELRNMVIVDNHIHSFSFQLENGIPIQEFQLDHKDTVLICLEKLLLELANQQNISEFLSQKLKLRKIIEQDNKIQPRLQQKQVKFSSPLYRKYSLV